MWCVRARRAQSFQIKHSEYGILGMANNGPHSATSQFYCTFAPCPTFDRTFSAFGKLVDGSKLLRFLESIDTSAERPRAQLSIGACGLLSANTLSGAAEDAAAAKVQSLHRARLARKEAKDRKEAAARIAAVKRGQKARQEKKQQVEAATKVQAISRGRKARVKMA